MANGSRFTWSKRMEHEQAFDVGEECRIQVEAISGDLEVSGCDGQQVRVRSSEDQATVVQDGPTLRIRPAPGCDLALRVPHLCDLTLHLSSGDVRLTGITGTTNIQTMSGDLRAESLHGDLQVRTVSGDISLRGTVSGDCLIESGRDQEGTYRASSVSGDLRLLFPEDQRCTVRVHSLSGRLRCQLPHSVLRHGWRDRETLINDGGVEFRVRTISGNILVKAAEHIVQSEEGSEAQESRAAQATAEPGRQPFDLDHAEETAGPASATAKRMEILRAVEEGEMGVDEALVKLQQLD